MLQPVTKIDKIIRDESRTKCILLLTILKTSINITTNKLYDYNLILIIITKKGGDNKFRKQQSKKTLKTDNFQNVSLIKRYLAFERSMST